MKCHTCVNKATLRILKVVSGCVAIFFAPLSTAMLTDLYPCQQGVAVTIVPSEAK